MEFFYLITGSALTLIAQVVTSRIQKTDEIKIDKQRLKIERIQRIVELAFEAEEWHEEYKQRTLFDQGGDIKPSKYPISEIRMLTGLYIKELTSEVNALWGASIALQKWMVDTRVRSSEAGHSSVKMEYMDMDEFNKCHEKLLEARVVILLSASKLISHIEDSE